jgi:hypothetical protein
VFGCYDCVVAVGVKFRALLFKAWQDSLLDIIAAKILDLLAANKRHSMLDFLRTGWRYCSSTHTQTMQWGVGMRTKPSNVAITRMHIVLKSTLQNRHQLVHELTVYALQCLM